MLAALPAGDQTPADKGVFENTCWLGNNSRPCTRSADRRHVDQAGKYQSLDVGKTGQSFGKHLWVHQERALKATPTETIREVVSPLTLLSCSPFLFCGVTSELKQPLGKGHGRVTASASLATAETWQRPRLIQARMKIRFQINKPKF